MFMLIVVIGVLLVLYGFHIASTQTIRLTIAPEPVGLAERTGKIVGGMFVVLGAALLMYEVWEHLRS